MKKTKNWLRHDSVQYIAEKPVSHTKILEIKYETESKKIEPSEIKGMRKASVINRSYFPQCATRSYEYTTGVSHSHSVGNEIEMGGEASVQTPKIKGLGGKMGGAVTFGFGFENSGETSDSDSTVVDATLEMPEESQLSVNILRRTFKQNIPYRSLIEKTYFDGSKAFLVTKGVYEAVSTSEIIVDYGEIKFLNGDSRYEDSPGLVYKYGENKKTWFNLGSDDTYIPPNVKQPVGIWGPSTDIEDGFCSIGDVAVQGYDYPEVQHLLVHAVKAGALVKPIGYFEEFDDTGSGVDTPVKGSKSVFLFETTFWRPKTLISLFTYVNDILN